MFRLEKIEKKKETAAENIFKAVYVHCINYVILYVGVIVYWLIGYMYLIDLTVYALFRDLL